MFVVAGVTGKTGSVVAETLLAKGKPVRVIVRDAANGAPWKARGAEVAIASVEDGSGLSEALRGAIGVYGLVPPDMSSRDPLGRARRVVEHWTRALEGSGATQLVFLSSAGAQNETGTGIVRTLHDAETRLRAQRTPTTFVRAAYFVENWLSSLPLAKEQGILPSFQALDRAHPQVATKDIGLAAANALLEPSASHRVIELAGPVDLSPKDVAALFATVLGREVTAVPVPESQIVPTLTTFGISPETADLFRGLAIGIDAGRLDFEGKGATFVRGATTAERVLREAVG